MSKQDALDAIDAAADAYAGVTHASMNASPGVKLPGQIRAQLADIRDLVDAIDEAEEG